MKDSVSVKNKGLKTYDFKPLFLDRIN